MWLIDYRILLSSQLNRTGTSFTLPVLEINTSIANMFWNDVDSRFAMKTKAHQGIPCP